MKKKYNNLNEEMKRIKSLFTEERLYGNLKENKLLTEQGIGRRLSDALETASSSVAKAIKNVDPKLATNFLNAEINTFDDLARHLNDYKSLWRSMGINWDYANDAILSFKKWSDSGFLKTADDKLILQVINDLPAEGDLRGMVFDLWKESKGKYTPPKTKSKTTIVTKSNTGENVVHKVETVGGKEKIETYKIEGDNIKKDDTYDPNSASKEVNDYYDGVDGGSSAGPTKATTDEINANGNPDVIKGEIIDAIERALKNLGDGKGRSITPEGLAKEIDGGKVLIVKLPNGGYRSVNIVEGFELIFDDNLNLISQKNLKPIDVTPPSSPIKDFDVDPTSGENPIIQKTIVDNTPKNNFAGKINDKLGQTFRYIFPTISESLKVVRFLTSGKKLYSNKRFSFVDYNMPKNAEGWSGKRMKNIEDVLRIIVVEQVALISLNEIYVSTQRGSLPDSESLIMTAGADYGNSKLWKYHPLGFLVVEPLKSVKRDLENLRKIGYARCRSKCESKFGYGNANTNSCISECNQKVDAFFNKKDEYMTALEEFSVEYNNIVNIASWNQKEIEDFCNDKEGKSTKLRERIKYLKESLQNFEKETNEQFKGKERDNEWFKDISDFLRNTPLVGGAFPKVPTVDELIAGFLPKTSVDGKPLSVGKLVDLENKLDQTCSEYWNKKREVDAGSEGGIIVDPDDFDDDVDTNKVIDQNELDKMFGKIEVLVEPIEIV
jgi:hypothetical protein